MNSRIDAATPVQYLKSVGPVRALALGRLGIGTVGDLLAHYPRRYFDRSAAVPVAKLVPGREGTVLGEVLTCGQRRTRQGGSLQSISVGDDTGVLFCVWFNQPFVMKRFRSGQKVMLSGVAQRHQGRWQFSHPDFEVVGGPAGADDDPRQGLHTGRLVPVYGMTAGVGQHWLRALMHQALQRCQAAPEVLPAGLVAGRGLVSRDRALRDIHFPSTPQDLEAARRRLVYEELFFMQVLMAMRRATRAGETGVTLAKPGDLTRRLVAGLPFALTGAQRRVLAEILADMRSGRAMHRLLQGDVGSGKTLVAFIAALFVIEQGYQALLMAPTEVLTRQHGRTLAALAAPLGVSVESLLGATPAARRREVLGAVGAGEIDLLVGTHAVLQEDVAIPRLALTVIDEQHRFGVKQRGRSARGQDTGPLPHVLVMSATPIPRSLALTLYGDLDLSVIDEMPRGRRPIQTLIARGRQEQEVWERCRREIAAGRQVYVVYPVIDQTEGQDLKAATVEHERLAAEVFPGLPTALLHGRLPGKQKDAIMTDFQAGRIAVLVATTVVEVGIDVPNATVMVIHHPERYGLAQLHQLRGRVGRGAAQGWCLLLCDRHLGQEAFERVRYFADHLDGFDLAEQDLRLRGPGEIWGVRQHGAPGFRMANPLRDADLAGTCQADARELLQRDPQLTGADGKVVRQELGRAWGSLAPFLAG